MEDLEKAEVTGHFELPDTKLEYDDILAMVQQLPQAYRTVFNLYVIEGYTHEEIGKLLGVSDGTSKSNLFKAKEKLKKAIMRADRQFNQSAGTENMNSEGSKPFNINGNFLNNSVLR